MLKGIRHNKPEVIILKKSSSRLIIFIIILTLLFIVQGCKKPEKVPIKNKNPQQGQTKPEEPEELKTIISNIEAIIKELENKKEIALKPQGETQEEPNQEEKTSSKEKEKKKEEPFKNWSKEEKNLKELHKSWNIVEMEAVKAGASDSLREEFENNLYILTDKIMNKNISESIIWANELYGSTAKIAQLFKTSNPPEGDIMKYYTTKALLAVEKNNWEEAKNNIEYLHQEWEKIKILMEDKDMQLVGEMDFSIGNMLDTIDIKNKEAGKIKGEIIISNIEKVSKRIAEIKKKKESS